MTAGCHTRTATYGGDDAPLAPWPAHAAPLSAYAVAELLQSMRARYLHLSDPARWDDDRSREIASNMAAGVKMSLDDLELALRFPR